MDGVEHELCNNCKKEIPQANYVMHTMHCSRNITLCKVCNEPIPKLEYESHREKCRKPEPKKPIVPPSNLEKSSYFQKYKEIEDRKSAVRRENYLKRHESLVDRGFTLNETVRSGYSNSTSNVPSALTETKRFNSLSTSDSQTSSKPITAPVVTKNKPNNGAIKKETKQPLIPRPDDNNGSSPKPKGPQGLLPCRYCDLELPKLDLEEHENYCGSRTDKCMECGELVMFKNKQVHLDSNHGFIKLKDEPGPRPSWESTTQRSSSVSNIDVSPARRNFRFTGFDYDPTPYLPAAYQPGGGLKKKDKSESYKEISRRLDCPAPQPPVTRRRNPPTELVIPCEFCNTPIPHDDLIQHETGCRPDLTRYNPRRNRSTVAVVDDDDYFVPPPRSDSPDDEELPCEFCANMVPASQLWRHQMTCTAPA